MQNEETVAASSPAEDVFRGETPTMEEFDRYRKTGEIPERLKQAEPAESAPADAPEQTAEEDDAPESEPEETQEQPPKATEAQKRIKQLLAKQKELEQKLAEKDGKPESSPVAEAPANPKPTPDDKKADGTPKYAEYEDYQEALARWAAKEERAKWEREYTEKEALKALQGKLEAARERYPDADDVIFPAGEAIHGAKIPAAVKQVFEDSDVFLDLCYVVGSDPDELKSFISLAQKNPRAAIGKVFEYERGIQEELSRPRDEKGKFAAPEPKKTSAPKPPSPVNGGSSRTFDVNDESLSADAWAEKRWKQVSR